MELDGNAIAPSVASVGDASGLVPHGRRSDAADTGDQGKAQGPGRQ
jgi:hypothetical protein